MRALLTTCALALLLGACLLGCTKPVAVPCPEPPTIPRPTFRIHQLPQDASTAQVLEAYVLDLAEQVGYADQLEAILDGYRRKPAPSTPAPRP